MYRTKFILSLLFLCGIFTARPALAEDIQYMSPEDRAKLLNGAEPSREPATKEADAPLAEDENPGTLNCIREARPLLEPCEAAADKAEENCSRAKFDKDTAGLKPTSGGGTQGSAKARYTDATNNANAFKAFANNCEKYQPKCSRSCQSLDDKYFSCMKMPFKDQHNFSTLQQKKIYSNQKLEICRSSKALLDEARRGQAAEEANAAEAKSNMDATSSEDPKKSDPNGKKDPAKADDPEKKDTAKKEEEKKEGGGDGAGGGGSPSGSGETPSLPTVDSQVAEPAKFSSQEEKADGARAKGDSTEGSTNADSSYGGSGETGPNGSGGMQAASSAASSVGGGQGGGASFGSDASFKNADGSANGAETAKAQAASSSGGGSSGGGGGGGGWGSPSSSRSPASESPSVAKMREALPGGPRDPARAASLVGVDGLTNSNTFNWNKMTQRFWKMRNEGVEVNFIGE